MGEGQRTNTKCSGGMWHSAWWMRGRSAASMSLTWLIASYRRETNYLTGHEKRAAAIDHRDLGRRVGEVVLSLNSEMIRLKLNTDKRPTFELTGDLRPVERSVRPQFAAVTNEPAHWP